MLKLKKVFFCFFLCFVIPAFFTKILASQERPDAYDDWLRTSKTLEKHVKGYICLENEREYVRFLAQTYKEDAHGAGLQGQAKDLLLKAQQLSLDLTPAADVFFPEEKLATLGEIETFLDLGIRHDTSKLCDHLRHKIVFSFYDRTQVPFLNKKDFEKVVKIFYETNPKEAISFCHKLMEKSQKQKGYQWHICFVYLVQMMKLGFDGKTPEINSFIAHHGDEITSAYRNKKLRFEDIKLLTCENLLRLVTDPFEDSHLSLSAQAILV